MKAEDCGMIAFRVFVYECETWSLTLPAEAKFIVFENKIWRLITGIPKVGFLI